LLAFVSLERVAVNCVKVKNSFKLSVDFKKKRSDALKPKKKAVAAKKTVSKKKTSTKKAGKKKAGKKKATKKKKGTKKKAKSKKK